jgi:hypothetical protein
MLIDPCTSDLTILCCIIMCGATAIVIYSPKLDVFGPLAVRRSLDTPLNVLIVDTFPNSWLNIAFLIDCLIVVFKNVVWWVHLGIFLPRLSFLFLPFVRGIFSTMYWYSRDICW